MTSHLPMIHHAQHALDWFQRTDAVEPTSENLTALTAIFVMGHHHLTTLKTLAVKLSEYDCVRPIIISGGLGRGTVFVRRKMEAFFSAREYRLPANYEAMSEARLISIFLDAVQCPKHGAWHLEQDAKHSSQNCEFALRDFGVALKLTSPDSRLGVVQCPTQRYRAIAATKRAFPCETTTLNLSPIDLAMIPESDQVIHVFRLVGLRSRGIEGELEILERYYSDEFAKVPPEIRRSYEYTANSFDECVRASEAYWQIIRHVVEVDPAKTQ